MDVLEKILGSAARIKIMRLFLLNKTKGFKASDVAKRSRVTSATVRRELKLLSTIGFIKKRSVDSLDWYFDTSFKYTKEFEDLLIKSDTLNRRTILDNFKKVGQTKLIITSGVFIKNDDSRVDLLIVGDKMKRGPIEAGIRKLEALLGAELVYAVFETKEFLYRLNMYDKLVRDILDYPHDVLLQSKDLPELSTRLLPQT